MRGVQDVLSCPLHFEGARHKATKESFNCVMMAILQGRRWIAEPSTFDRLRPAFSAAESSPKDSMLLRIFLRSAVFRMLGESTSTSSRK